MLTVLTRTGLILDLSPLGKRGGWGRGELGRAGGTLSRAVAMMAKETGGKWEGRVSSGSAWAENQVVRG